MAQLNITLNQEEILSLLQENSGDAFKKLLQESLNAVLKAESKEQLKADHMNAQRSVRTAVMDPGSVF